MLSPLDDFPVHQIAEPIRYVVTSDRNFYDRYYFNLHHRDDDLMVTAGLGQYPNLGVTDAFVAVTRGGWQRVVRSSRELGDDRMETVVGPIGIEVIEGLRRFRLWATPEPAGGDDIDLDVTWTPSIAAFLEARHVNRRGARLMTDTSRFFQTGFWSGHLRVAGEDFAVEPTQWWGGRDRSWGIRPVGEAEPAGRRQADGPGGFLWLYCTMQFDDFSVLAIVQEDRRGGRTLEQAVRIWRDGDPREPEPLGHFHHDLRFAAGSRRIEHAELTFTPPGGKATTVLVEPVAASYLSIGTGYGMDDDWRHGMYQGPLRTQRLAFDLSDPHWSARTYGLIDNLARFELDGEVGYGLFENAVLGPNDRYGFGARS
jgi:hypothetical protein